MCLRVLLRGSINRTCDLCNISPVFQIEKLTEKGIQQIAVNLSVGSGICLYVLEAKKAAHYCVMMLAEDRACLGQSQRTLLLIERQTPGPSKFPGVCSYAVGLTVT